MKYSVLTVYMVSAAFLFAKPVFAETLRESVEQALAAHPSVDAAVASKVIAKEERLEVRSGLFPEFSANFSAGRIFGDNSTSRGLTVDRGTAYSFLGEGSAALIQPLFDGRETVNRLDAAQARSQSADYSVTDAKQNLAFRAAQAHLSVLQAQATLDKTKSYYLVIQDYLDRIQLMVDEGVADETEIAQARNIDLMLKSTMTDFEGQLDAAYAGYNEVVGRMPKSDLLKPLAPNDLIEENVEQAISSAKEEHPLVKSGEKELEAAKYDVKAEKSGFFPEIDGELSYLKRDQEEEIGGEARRCPSSFKNELGL